MNRVALFLLLALAGYGTTPIVDAAPAAVTIYPRDREIALALSAAPAALRAQAGVYALARDGFVQVRQTRNGFTCIVNRDGPFNEKPVCFDAVGSKYILPVDVKVGDMLLHGASVQQIRKAVLVGFRDGTFRIVDRPGVAYMLSDHKQLYDRATGKTMMFPPHVMFYAPNLTNRDIGSAGDFAMGLPSIGYEGPTGFMIVPCGQYCGEPLKMRM
jgi:hypothetical protein